MDGIRALKGVLKQGLGWHGARIDLLARLICALFQVKTVNLAQRASALSGRASVEAHDKRLQRFFRGFDLDYGTLAHLLVGLLPAEAAPWVLTLDRTQWQFGRVDINLLVLGIVWRGVTWPVVWTVLEKRGHSNTAERIALLERFIALFGRERIAHLLADREFVGRAWFDYLLRQGVGFRIRIKPDTHIAAAQGRPVPAWLLFCDLAPHTLRVLGMRRVWGLPLAVAGVKRGPGDYVIVVGSGDAQPLLEDYRVRWATETLFACLKTRGFRLEDTHLTDPQRLSKLLAVLALTFAWAHRTGEWLCQHQPIRLKKPSGGRQRAASATALTTCGA